MLPTGGRSCNLLAGWVVCDAVDGRAAREDDLGCAVGRQAFGVTADGGPDPYAAGRAGFREFVVAQGAHLLRVAFLLTGDRTEAEDLRQDVLEALYVAWPRVQDPFAYARTAMTRRAVNRWRLRARRREMTLSGD